MNVLIVEDEMLVAKGIKRTLEKIDINVVGICENGATALDFLSFYYRDVDIVITDIKMPLLSGTELIKIANERYPELQFVVLSGYGEFEIAQEVMKYGVKQYLLKPYSSEKLFDAIASLAKGSENEAENFTELTMEQSEDCELENKNNIIQQILKIIDENLNDEELSLKKISQEKVFLNTVYLGRLFYNETGQSFSKYVTKKRIEYAKKLIRTSSDELIYEISQKVGFGDNSQYFSQVFKKNTGYTPSEYKKLCLKERGMVK